MEDTGVVVIGAGVVGLAVTEALAARGREVVLVERMDSFGRHASSRNSEVIHAGFFYRPGSVRAQVCVEGKHLLYDLCERRSIPYRRIGKLVVAAETGDEDELSRLYGQGRENGLDDLRFLSRAELQALSPQLQVLAAFESPSSGIIDSHALMACLERTAAEHGAVTAYGCEVTGIDGSNGRYIVEVVEGSGERSRIRAEAVVNSAGLHSAEVSRLAGIDPAEEGYEIRYLKGEYARIAHPDRAFAEKLVYPVPHGLLDIHLVVGLQGQLRLGTYNTMVGSEVDYAMLQEDTGIFYSEAKRYLPLLRAEDLVLDMCGIAPTLFLNGKSGNDYIVRDEADRGCPGLINLIGIGSPGLTSCLAIAQRVRGLLT